MKTLCISWNAVWVNSIPCQASNRTLL